MGQQEADDRRDESVGEKLKGLVGHAIAPMSLARRLNPSEQAEEEQREDGWAGYRRDDGIGLFRPFWPEHVAVQGNRRAPGQWDAGGNSRADAVQLRGDTGDERRNGDRDSKRQAKANERWYLL